jgi:hypothetical protein
MQRPAGVIAPHMSLGGTIVGPVLSSTQSRRVSTRVNHAW